MPFLQARPLRDVSGANNVQRMADVAAAASSGLCAIHCLAMPVLLIFLPVLGATFLGGETFHAAILWLILPTSLIAMTLGCRRHRDHYVALLCAVGLAAIVAAVVIGHEGLGEAGERIVTLAGSLVLIAGHVRNFSLCRSTACTD